MLATEIQGPQTPDDPSLEALLDLRERLSGSPAIALVARLQHCDAGGPDVVRRRASAPPAWRAATSTGSSRCWREGAHVGELFAAIAATGAPDGAQDEARSGFVRFGRQDPPPGHRSCR